MSLKNIYFENIEFPEVASKVFSDLPVGGLFEVCADTNDLYFNNIKIKNTVDDFKKMGVSVIKAGPLSATWKHAPENSDTWTEVFYPDDICTMKNTHIGKVEFTDKCATADDKEIVAKAIKLTVNSDYPKTTPKGGTGYGIIENIIFE